VRRPIRLAWVSACSAAALVVGVAAGPGFAAPSRDIAQVQAQVRDLQMKAASASERYNEAQIEFQDTQQRLAGIKDKAARERAELAVATASVNDLARGVYMSGGMDSTLQVLLADNPTDFLAQSAALDQVAHAQASSIRRTQTTQLRLAQSQAAAADQEQLAQGFRNQMDQAKQEADSNLAAAQDVLDSLQEAERRRLAELEAQQAAAERAAAAQAAADLAAQQAQNDNGNGGDTGGGGTDSGGGDTGGGDTGGGAESSGGGYTGGSRAAAAVSYALAQVGKSYVAAADGPSSFDCSGLTMAAWRQAGVSLSHYSYSQYGEVRRISDSELQPGDLVFYFGGGAHHVGMYVGNGKMVSASNPSDGVEIIDYKGPWYGERYSGAGRVVG
jgi:peptidoglycan DL-endopeptidase CwlO